MYERNKITTFQWEAALIAGCAIRLKVFVSKTVIIRVGFVEGFKQMEWLGSLQGNTGELFIHVNKGR